VIHEYSSRNQRSKELQRNDPNVLAAGVEDTGEILLTNLARRIGRPDLGGLDLFDVGCGVRFTQTLINRSLAFHSYTGIEVYLPIVRWLKENVESKDERFRFFHWNVHNAMYNQVAPPMSMCEALPGEGSYDVIMGFSLFTHLAPEDASQMLKLMRKAARPDGFLFFSAFCSDSLETFEDRVPGKPLLNAYYNSSYLERLVKAEGWEVVSHEEPGAYYCALILMQTRGARAQEGLGQGLTADGTKLFTRKPPSVSSASPARR
jgi:SAM-dependent methyltransferase